MGGFGVRVTPGRGVEETDSSATAVMTNPVSRDRLKNGADKWGRLVSDSGAGALLDRCGL